MIYRWLFWKVLKTAFLIGFLFTFLFLVFQIIRLDQIIFRLPLSDSLPFLLLWFFYYFSYMLPTALFIAFALNLYELKESKKLYVIQSFGLRPLRLYEKSLLFLIPLLFALSFVSYILREEDISSVRKRLMLKYYALIITSVPPQSFQTFGQFTLYVEKRQGDNLEGIFFKFNEGVLVARRASIKGGGTITFEEGSLLTQREGKTFSTDFKVYRLSLSQVLEEDRQTSRRKHLVGIFNVLSVPLLMGIAYRLVWLTKHHQSFYYLIGLLSVLYQLFLLILRQKL